MTALALALQWVILGLHVLVPWRLARLAPPAAAGTPDRRQLWAMVATPLLLAAALIGLFTIGARLDAALAWGLVWPPRSVAALSLVFAGIAVGFADLLLFFGFRRLEPAGWRIAAGLGGFLLVAASVAGELLRLGRGPMTGLVGLAVTALCRVPLALAAGEASSGPVRGFAALAGVALPFSLLAFAAPLRAMLGADLLTLGAAVLLLLAARLLPPSLRRPAALIGVLLAALFLDRTGDLQAALEPPSTIPDLFLPEP
ncbi:MAG: hypothetical protein ABI689_05080 [Thermoanaerobaculia bacterium]